MVDKRIDNGGTIRRITDEDREQLEQFAPLKISATQIGKCIGRGKTVVNREYERGGGREGYTAEKGRQGSKRALEIKKEKMRKEPSDEMVERISRMAQEGYTCKAIRNATNCSYGYVMRIMKENGITPLSLFGLQKDIENRFDTLEETLRTVIAILEEK